MTNNEKLVQRDVAVDAISDALYATMLAQARWTAPCTMGRTNAMPLDPDSCFKTYEELTTYITKTNEGKGGVGYPGQFVFVTNHNDEKAGPYVLVSNGTSLIPMKLGTQEAGSTAGAEMFWLNSDGSRA